MTKKDDALKLALDYVLTHSIDPGIVFAAIKDALEQSDQTSCYCPNCEALSRELSDLKDQKKFVAFDPLPRACNLAGIDYKTFLKIKAYMPVAPQREPLSNEECDDLKDQQEPDVVMHTLFNTWTINKTPPKGIDDVGLWYRSPQRKPLTDEQKEQLWCDKFDGDTDFNSFCSIAEAIEAAHGIK